MNFNLNDRTIYLILSGSRAYGFSSPTSDYDYRGIAIPPIDSYLGIFDKFEQCVDSDKGKHVYKHFPKGLLVDSDLEHPDMQIMEISKFANLATQSNPSILEILFSPENCFVRKDPIMDRLLNIRNAFLSKQVKARFCGYALSQLKRIKRHKRWIDNPPSAPPNRADYGLPEYKLLSMDQLGAAEALIQKEVNEFVIHQDDLPEHVKIELNNGMGRMMRAVWQTLNPNIDYPIGDDEKFISTEDALFFGLAKQQGFTDNFLQVLAAEKKYRTHKKDWDSYQRWLKDRNPARAELEKKFGFDTKHATHLVRLLRMAREILETWQVNVFREDAEELREVRAGGWSFEKIVDFAEKEDLALFDVMQKSSLPKNADMNEIHNLITDMILEYNISKSIRINSNMEELLRNEIIKMISSHNVSNYMFYKE